MTFLLWGASAIYLSSASLILLPMPSATTFVRVRLFSLSAALYNCTSRHKLRLKHTRRQRRQSYCEHDCSDVDIQCTTMVKKNDIFSKKKSRHGQTNFSWRKLCYAYTSDKKLTWMTQYKWFNCHNGQTLFQSEISITENHGFIEQLFFFKIKTS